MRTLWLSRTAAEGEASRLIRLFDPLAEKQRAASGQTPQSPDPNKPKPNPNTNPGATIPINRPPSRKDGKVSDPILLGDGSFDLSQTDLSFPTPTGALDFTRTYNSRSDDRGTLGSNWVHNWDVWLERLNRDNTPSWAMPYCLGTDPGLAPQFGSDPVGVEPRTTCLVLHRGDASSQLFFLAVTPDNSSI